MEKTFQNILVQFQLIPDLPGRENRGRQDASRNGLGLESPATCGGIRLRHLLRRGYEGQEGYGGQAAAFTDCPGTEAATLGKTGLCGLEGADTIHFLTVSGGMSLISTF